MQVVDFEINRVIVADRQRRPVDNLAGLVASIQDVGLLHPIVVGTDGRLKVGYRRLMAFQQMGRATIPAHVTDDLDEVYRALCAERDENIQREPLPPTMLVARAEEMEAEEKRSAADRMRATQLNGRDSTGEPVFGCGNFPQPMDHTGKTRDFVGAAFGISGKTYEKARAVMDAAAAHPETFGDLPALMDSKSIDTADRERRRREHANLPKPELPTGKYSIIYADPPWRYDFSRDAADDIENHYPTMETADICALPIADLAADDSVLFLWATSPKLQEALTVIEAWEFRYITCMIWDKELIGLGYYARQCHELLLICKRGALPVPLPENRPPSVYHERRTEHSKKPVYFYEMIEKMYPGLSKVELFAREARAGWTAWGNEL